MFTTLVERTLREDRIQNTRMKGITFWSLTESVSPFDTEIVKEEDKGTHILRTELVRFGTDEPFEHQVAYTHDGGYIGSEQDAEALITKRGIKPECIPGHKVCSIGFSERDQKWYGWSHRAIYGFKVGDVLTGNDDLVEFRGKIKTIDQARECAIQFANNVA